MTKDKPDWGQSASTWRHTSLSHKFSKTKRFSNDKASHTDIIEIEHPPTNNKVACTFGKGKKRPISVVVMRNAK